VTPVTWLSRDGDVSPEPDLSSYGFMGGAEEKFLLTLPSDLYSSLGTANKADSLNGHMTVSLKLTHKLVDYLVQHFPHRFSPLLAVLNQRGVGIIAHDDVVATHPRHLKSSVAKLYIYKYVGTCVSSVAQVPLLYLRHYKLNSSIFHENLDGSGGSHL